MIRLVEYLVVLDIEPVENTYNQFNGRIIQKFPEIDWEDFSFESMISQICQPCGWNISKERLPPNYFITHLTDINYDRYFASCLTFYEEYKPKNPLLFYKKTRNNEMSGIYGKESADPTDNTAHDPYLVQPPEYYAPKTIVLISRHQHFDVLKNCLSLLYTSFVNTNQSSCADGNKLSNGNRELEILIANMLSSVTIPPVGSQKFSFSLGMGDLQIVVPSHCPTIPVTKHSVVRLFQHLSIKQVLMIFSAIICDEKIILVSRSLNRLSESCHALASILYPLKYGYAFVPTLPKSLLDCIYCPTPFFYGVHSSYYDKIADMTGVFAADLDGGNVYSPENVTLPEIPNPFYDDVVENLYKILKPDLLTADQLYSESDSNENEYVGNKRMDQMSEEELLNWQDKQLRAVFLNLFTTVFAGYRSCLFITRIHPKPVIFFSRSLFLLLRGISEKDPFFKALLTSMRFLGFIQERGASFRVCDVFDDEYDLARGRQPGKISNQSYCQISEFQKNNTDNHYSSGYSYEDSMTTSINTSFHQINSISKKLLENECPSNISPKHQMPPDAKSAYKRLHQRPFPMLDSSYIMEKIYENQRKKIKSIDYIPKQEPRFVPVGQYLDRQIFRSETLSDKNRVIKGFVTDIFDLQITEALKRRNTIRQDLRLRPFRRLFIDELHRHISTTNKNSILQYQNFEQFVPMNEKYEDTEKKTTLTWEQFELILDLIDEALKHEALSDSTGIHPTVMELCTKFNTMLGNQRYFMNMTPQIQRHHIWSDEQFWECVFNDQVNNQIRQHYIHHDENDRTTEAQPLNGDLSHSLYTPNMTALEIVAEEMRIGHRRSKEQIEQLITQEERTVYAQIIHLINLIINFHVPVTAGAISTNAVTAASTIMQNSHEPQANENDYYPIQNGHENETSALVSIKRTEEILKKLESWLRTFVSRLTFDNSIPSSLYDNDWKTKIENLVEGHLLILESIYPEVKNIPKWKKPEITAPNLIEGEIVVRIGGQASLPCQLLVDGRIEKGEWNWLDLTAFISNDGEEKTENRYDMGPQHMTNGQNGTTMTNLDSTNVDDEIDFLMRPLIPARGAIFLTNYRLIFVGVPRDPYQSNKMISRSVPLSALLQIKHFKNQKIVTLLPATSGYDTGINNNNKKNSQKMRTKIGGLFKIGNSPINELYMNNGIIRVEETLDVFRIRACTMQLLRIAFDMNDLTTDIRDEFRQLLLYLRYPNQLNVGFNSLPNNLPAGSFCTTSFDEVMSPEEIIKLTSNQLNNNTHDNGLKETNGIGSRLNKNRLNATMLRVFSNTMFMQNGNSNLDPLYDQKNQNINFNELKEKGLLNGSKSDHFYEETMKLLMKNIPKINKSQAIINYFLNSLAYKDLLKIILELGKFKAPEEETFVRLSKMECFSERSEESSLLSGHESSSCAESAGESHGVNLKAVNCEYTIAKSYPAFLLLPGNFNESKLIKISKLHKSNRFPILTWHHQKTKTWLCRSGCLKSKTTVAQLKGALLSQNKYQITREFANGKPPTGPPSTTLQYQSALSGSVEFMNREENVSSAREYARYLQAIIDISPRIPSKTIEINGIEPSASIGSPEFSLSSGIDSQSILTRQSNPLSGSDGSNRIMKMNKIKIEETLGRMGLGLKPSVNRRENGKNPDSVSLSSGSNLQSINSHTTPTSVYILCDKSFLKQQKPIRFSNICFLPVDCVSCSDVKKAFELLYSACVLETKQVERLPNAFQLEKDYHHSQHTNGNHYHDPSDNNHTINGHNNNNVVQANSENMEDAMKGDSKVDGQISSASDFLISLKNSDWLKQVQNLLQLSGSVVDIMDIQAASVVLSLEEGVDYVAQISSLVQLMLDPYYRTISGFWTLIEKEWITFGHKFSQRNYQTIADKPSNSKERPYCPVFLQFLDAVHQLLHQFPLAFEFNDFYLKFLAYHHCSNRFLDFKMDSEFERLSKWLNFGAEFVDEDKDDLNEMTFFQKSIKTYIDKQHKEWPIFFNFRYQPQLSLEILRPSTTIPSLDIWSYYLSEDLATGPIYDLDFFCPSYRKNIQRVYEPVLRHGFNNNHVEHTYAVLGLREGDVVDNWQEKWTLAQRNIELDIGKYLNISKESQCSQRLFSNFEMQINYQCNPKYITEDFIKLENDRAQMIRDNALIEHKKISDECLLGVKDQKECSIFFEFDSDLAIQSNTCTEEIKDEFTYQWHQMLIQELFANAHTFVRCSSGLSPCKCAVCNSVILMMKSAVRCSLCQFTCHEKCALNAPKKCLEVNSQINTSFSSPPAVVRNGHLPARSHSSVRRANNSELNISQPFDVKHENSTYMTGEAILREPMSPPRRPNTESVTSFTSGRSSTNGFVPSNGKPMDAHVPHIESDADSIDESNSISIVQRKQPQQEVSDSECSIALQLNSSLNSKMLIPSTEIMERGEFSSFLYKQSHVKFINHWKKRFFVLNTQRHQIQYYESREDEVLRGYIDLQDVRQIKLCEQPAQITNQIRTPSNCTIQLTTSSRAYKLASEDHTIVNEWIERIQNALQ